HITIWLFFALLMFSCKEIDEITHFYIEQETEITLDTTNLAGCFFSTTSSPVFTLSDSIYQANHTNASHVTQIILKSLLLKLSYTDTLPEFHVELADIYLVKSDGKQKHVAWNGAIPPDVLTPIPLFITTDNLNDILSDSTVQYMFEGIVSDSTIGKTKWSIQASFYVNAVVVN
ncbi:MAG: hypothetical protein K9G61_09265, partial [Bacteroidales bacterium]|nr:hypothetical protein [Bacteroidales bacterium]